jgi:autotransporter translocation and assembly factor TamB
MAGSWQFTAQSSIFGLSFSVTGKIAQIENDVSGQLEITGTPCATSAAFNGTVSGTSALTMNLNENGQVVVFSGTLASDGNSASGTYSAPSGGCTNGDKGTWSGQRVSTGN